MSEFVRVAINIAQISETYDYAVPAGLRHQVRPGSLVTVPFGRQLQQGIVVKEISTPAVTEVKEILSLVDPLPAVSLLQISWAEALQQEFLAPAAQFLDLMIPPGLSQHADVLLSLTSTNPEDVALTSLQQRLLATLQSRGSLRGSQLDTAFPHADWRASLPGLIKQGLVRSEPMLRPPAVHARQLRTALLAISFDAALKMLNERTRQSETVRIRREAVLALLVHETTPVNLSMIYAETGANQSDLKTMEQMGLLTFGESEYYRDPLLEMRLKTDIIPALTSAQAAVWQVLENEFSEPSGSKLNLLVGVTGSGKTEIYLHAAAKALAQGRGVFILVPEISLTPQTVQRFYARFPGKVALVHSKLSPGERYDTWRRIRSGELPLVVGARSALFSPLPNPGLIVLDECHDGSYYQDDMPPRFSAVKAAEILAALAGIPLLLGSATPSVDQLYQARRSGWHELRLPDRILAHQQTNTAAGAPGTLPLPPVEVVDMRTELKAGNRSVLSRALRKGISEALEQNQQAILFLNRRGSATYVFCRDCGYVLRCPRCDTQLTFHAVNEALLCHNCGYRRQMPKICPQCKSSNIRQFGLGTETLEKAIAQEFPSARLLRWDADTTRAKGANDLILDHFTQHRADILIGTQMLAKGLDLPLVTLVGVVLADTSLNLPDYRAAERTFQLLSQVAGRAGRSARGGKAIFQTYHPENYAIRYASLHDLEGFYEEELALRQKMHYPPFARLLRIEFRGQQAQSVQTAAEQAGASISSWSKEYSLEMIGPVPCFYARRNNLTRWQILLRGWEFTPLFHDHPLNTWSPRGVEIDLTVDPPSIL